MPKRSETLINADSIKALEPGERQVFLWDSLSPGFGVRVTPNGVKSYVLDYRIGSRRRRVTLGLVSEMKLKDARKKASAWRDRVRIGEDPLTTIEERRDAPLVRDLRKRFMKEHAPKRSRSTVRNYEVLWKKLAHLETVPVADIRWEHIAAVHAAHAGRPYAGNRFLALVSKAWALAKRWGWYPRELPNPGREHDRHAEQRRGVALSPDELRRIGKVLEAKKSSPTLAALRVVFLTGARPAEVCSARWDELNGEGQVLHLPRTKTGPRALYLGEPAAKVVAEQLRVGPYIFPGRELDKPLKSIRRRAWYRVRDAAGLPEHVRLYDARHTWATFAEELGVSEDRRRRLTGHSVAGVHAGYIHVRDQVLLAEADRVAGVIDAAMRGETA